MTDKIRTRSRKTSEGSLPLKIDEKTTVLSDDEAKKLLAPRLSLREFRERYANEEYSDEELLILYLRGYENLVFDEIAVQMGIRKKKAREIAKELEKEISNIKIEKSIEIKKFHGATKTDIQETNAIMLGRVQRAILQKLDDEDSLRELSLKELSKMLKDLSDNSFKEGQIYTGRSLSKIKLPSIDESINVEY